MSSTSATGAPVGAGKFGTRRGDPRQAAHGWKLTLGVPEMGKITSICGDILNKLGFPGEELVSTIAAERAKEIEPSSIAMKPAMLPPRGGLEPWWKKMERKKRSERASKSGLNAS